MTGAGLLAALGATGLPCPASARSSGHGSLERAVERALHCEATRLTSGRDLDCATSLAGAQRDFVEDVVALAYGDLRNTSLLPAGLHAPLRCQQAIARTAARLTGQALAGVANGAFAVPGLPSLPLTATWKSAVVILSAPFAPFAVISISPARTARAVHANPYFLPCVCFIA